MSDLRTESETFSIGGAFQRADGGMINDAEMDKFMDAFIELVESHGLLFGGGHRLDPEYPNGYCRQEIKDAQLTLRSAISMLEDECEIEVDWKEDALALIERMEATLGNIPL